MDDDEDDDMEGDLVRNDIPGVNCSPCDIRSIDSQHLDSTNRCSDQDDDTEGDLVRGDIPGVNCSPCDIRSIDSQQLVRPMKRSVSQPPPLLESITSLIRRSVSERLPKYGKKSEKIQKSTSGEHKFMSKVSSWWGYHVEGFKSRERAAKHSQQQKEQSEEFKMRHRLKYHFMSPMQKYRHGRKPWKLLIQIMKIIIVTTQVALFGAERFSSVLFINHTQESLRHLFIRGFTEPLPFNYYSRQDLAEAVIFAKDTYNKLLNKSIGIYWYDNSSEPMSLCVERYMTDGNNSDVIDYTNPTHLNCTVGIPYTKEQLLKVFHRKRYFDSLKALFLKFQVRTMFINGLRMLHRPECYHLDNMVYIDNDNHDGKLAVSFQMEHILMQKCPKEFKATKDANRLREFYVAFDVLVAALCSISLILCLRSVSKSIKLASVAREYFLQYKGEVLTRLDLFELINKWFFVLVLSDLLSIMGSIYKIRVDYRDIHYYNLCSLFLGIGVLLVWVGILRFFTYLPNYNVLLIALRVAAPNLLRFMFCALFIFFGFTFCGWIVLGPYHEKFDTFSKTCDCLYSLLNGDDMYVTFNIMSDASMPVWIFSKIYLYVFISLFIYVVLSTFISIVSDSYERMKLSGKMPPTRIESFMAGKQAARGSDTYCEICSRDDELSESSMSALYRSMRENKDLTASTMSVMSASID